MLLGDFESAWAESDAIQRRGKPDPNRFWDGRSPRGRDVIVRCLHGLGDTLQFIRYVHLLHQQANSVVIEAQPPLKPLLQESRLADCVITWGDAQPFWDMQIEIMELPRIFRTTLQTIPTAAPYLRIDAGAGSESATNSRLRVGIAWASGAYNPARSVPLQEIARLCKVRHIELFSLQAEPERSELASCGAPICDLYHQAASVLSAARTLQTMSIVITVDTMMAHLAGALGCRTWTLLPYACDWRWMLRRRDSPWYPSMRLFRQPRPGDWHSVIEEVQSELCSLTPGSSRVS